MKIALLAPSDAYLYNFRGALAAALKAAGHEVLLISPPGPHGDLFLKRGFRWLAAPMDRASLNPLKELWLLVWLYRLLKRERVDLVHGFVMKGALYGALAGRMAGVPARVSSITGLGYLFLSEDATARVLRLLIRLLSRLAFSGAGSRVVLQNRDDLALFRDQGLVKPGNLVLIPGSGVACDRFSPPATAGEAAADDGPASRDSGEFRVLLPARLLFHKGIAEYAEAARILRDQGRSVRFLLAGEFDTTNPSSIPESTIQRWGRDGLIQWLGYVQDMPALLHTVDVVVLPSYREGLPKALVEGAACGLPLIATDVPGCREVVTDGVEGLLVPPKDPGALADAILRLQDDPALCIEMGKRARAKALAEFDEGMIVSRTFSVYAELVAGFDAAPVAGAEWSP
jgi:glycosyltransferase involved in cell wall biosynthesis